MQTANKAIDDNAIKIKDTPALFFLDSMTNLSFSLIEDGYFLLPIRYISKPPPVFPLNEKTPQSFGCFCTS